MIVIQYSLHVTHSFSPHTHDLGMHKNPLPLPLCMHVHGTWSGPPSGAMKYMYNYCSYDELYIACLAHLRSQSS